MMICDHYDQDLFEDRERGREREREADSFFAFILLSFSFYLLYTITTAHRGTCLLPSLPYTPSHRRGLMGMSYTLVVSSSLSGSMLLGAFLVYLSHGLATSPPHHLITSSS